MLLILNNSRPFQAHSLTIGIERHTADSLSTLKMQQHVVPPSLIALTMNLGMSTWTCQFHCERRCLCVHGDPSGFSVPSWTCGNRIQTVCLVVNLVLEYHCCGSVQRLACSLLWLGQERMYLSNETYGCPGCKSSK